MNKTILYLIIFIIVLSSVYAFTFQLDENNIFEGETMVVDITTILGSEKGDPYTVYWYKADGTLLETDAGVMSNILGGTVFETYQSMSGDDTINGNVSFDLNNNGIDDFKYFNISTPNVSLLIISDAKFSPEAKIGTTFAIDFEILQNNKSINNAECSIYGTDVNDAPIQACTFAAQYSRSFDGRATCDGILANSFIENEEYLAKIRCNCGKLNNACYNSDGVDVENTFGETTFVFQVTPYLSSINTITDKSNYEIDDTIYVCVNITNNNSIRRGLDITYSYRCQNGKGDASTDRILLGEKKERRGISGNTTQNQCTSFTLIDDITIEKGGINCYASTSTSILNPNNEVIYTYESTSPLFNIQVDEINPFIRWTRINQYQYNGTINITDYNVGVKDIDIRVNPRSIDVNTPATSIRDYSITYLNGSTTPYELELQLVESSRTLNKRNDLEIEYFDEVTITILNVNTTMNESFIVNVEFDSKGVEGDNMIAIVLVLVSVIIFLLYFSKEFEFMYFETIKVDKDGQKIIDKIYIGKYLIYLIAGWLCIPLINIGITIVDINNYNLTNTIGIFYKAYWLIMFIFTAFWLIGFAIYGLIRLNEWGNKIK